MGQVGFWLNRAVDKYDNGDIRLWGIGHSLGAHLLGMAGHVGKKVR